MQPNQTTAVSDKPQGFSKNIGRIASVVLLLLALGIAFVHFGSKGGGDNGQGNVPKAESQPQQQIVPVAPPPGNTQGNKTFNF